MYPFHDLAAKKNKSFQQLLRLHYHRCRELAKLPRLLPPQHWLDRVDWSGNWDDTEAEIYTFCSLCLRHEHLPLWFRQNNRWWWNQLAGQELWLLWQTIFFLVLLAANYHNQKQQSGHIFPHRSLRFAAWLVINLDRCGTRYEKGLLINFRPTSFSRRCPLRCCLGNKGFGL